MDNLYLSALVREAEPELLGRSVLRASLASSILLIDLRLPGSRQLLASLDRAAPAFYISTETASQAFPGKTNPTFFLSLLRKHIVDARVVRLRKDPLDRVVQIDFERLDAGDNKVQMSLVLSLTGRSANASLLDAHGEVIGTLFDHDAKKQPSPVESSIHAESSLASSSWARDLSASITQTEVLERFFGARSVFGPQLKNEFLARCSAESPSAAFRSLIEDLFERDPQPILYSRIPLDQIGQEVLNPKTDLMLSHIELTQAGGLLRYQFPSFSEAAEQYYRARAGAISLRAEHSALRHTLASEITKRESALRAIESDRDRFDNPDRLKRLGDLILANLATARMQDTTVTVVDYYDPDQSRIQIQIPEGLSLKEAAADYFGRYQKARRALAAIATREREVLRNLAPLRRLLASLEASPAAASIAEISKGTDELLGTKRNALGGADRAKVKGSALGRRFRSSDGYEIVVGRNDRDNDALTFRVARPNDIWLHAADYPGSHAIIRNPARDAPPHRSRGASCFLFASEG